MKKSVAMDLQYKYDKRIGDLMGEECEISLTLSNKVKINFGYNFITFRRDSFDVCYINFTGNYSDLQNCVSKIQEFLRDNKEEVDLLMWTYDNIMNLED